MKKMNPSHIQSKKEVFYYSFKDTLIIDGVCIKHALDIRKHNLTEAHFKDIPCLDRSIERLLMIAAAMLVDFHFHHWKIEARPWDECWDDEPYWDDNPKESEEILHEVHASCRVILQKVFQGDWRSMTGYISLTMALLDDVIRSFMDFSILMHMSIELDDMIPRN